MQNNCAASKSLNLENCVSIFFYFYWLSFYRSVKLALKAAKRKIFKIKEFADRVLFHVYQ